MDYPLLESLGYDPFFIPSNIKSDSGTEYRFAAEGWDNQYAAHHPHGVLAGL